MKIYVEYLPNAFIFQSNFSCLSMQGTHTNFYLLTHSDCTILHLELSIPSLADRWTNINISSYTLCKFVFYTITAIFSLLLILNLIFENFAFIIIEIIAICILYISCISMYHCYITIHQFPFTFSLGKFLFSWSALYLFNRSLISWLFFLRSRIFVQVLVMAVAFQIFSMILRAPLFTASQWFWSRESIIQE